MHLLDSLPVIPYLPMPSRDAVLADVVPGRGCPAFPAIARRHGA